MTGRTSTPQEMEQPQGLSLPIDLVQGLVDAVDEAFLVSDRAGTLLLANGKARKHLATRGFSQPLGLNLFSNVLCVDAGEVFSQIEGGQHEVKMILELGEAKYRARMRWMPDSDWLVVQLAEQVAANAAGDPGTHPTVQELLQEREITYRNLLAAYLKLQEVNRQKTVFLASAAHELKTPLAVIKGYYDFLLTGSLGKLTEKQSDILEESKESCERLVRLVSMFLNYSALESGKLVLQLRDNDLRDCLEEMSKRWSEAFQRKGVKLEAHLDPSIPTFRFDYQKVQQAAANLLDNALKHTPGRRQRDAVSQSTFLGAADGGGFAGQKSAEDSVCRDRIAWK